MPILVADVPLYLDPGPAVVQAGVTVQKAANWALRPTKPETRVSRLPDVEPKPVVSASAPAKAGNPPGGCQAYSATVYFAFDSAQPDPAALAGLLPKLPVACTYAVTGFTDPVGGWNYNLKLGHKRAAVVAGWLEQHGYTLNGVHSLGKAAAGLVTRKRADFDLDRRAEVQAAPQPEVPAAPQRAVQAPTQPADGCTRMQTGVVLQCGSASH